MPPGERLGLRSLLRIVPAAVRRDYAATFVVQWFVLGVGLLLFHLVARRGSVSGFTYYQIARSTVSTFQPALLLGFGLGLHRYLPRTERTTRRLALHALGIEAAVVTVFVLAGVLVAGELAALLGLPGRSAVIAVLIMLAGNCLCTLGLAALRGNHQVVDANLILGLGFGLTPLFAFAAATRIEDFLIIQGIGTALVGVWGMLVVRRQPATAEEQTAEPDVKTLIAYGVRRMPGELALPALYTFPTLAVAVRMPGSPEAGYVGFTTSAVTLICSVFAMLTPVLMPRLSRLFHRAGEDSGVRQLLTVLPLLAALLAAIPTGVIVLFAHEMVRGFLGHEFADAVPVLRLGVVAAIPLAMFYAARPTMETLLDARFMSRLLLACLALEFVVTGIGAAFLTPAHAAVLGLAAASLALGLDAVGLAAYAVRHPRR
jgi:O-antigen/teichoic acid export membrane protein